MRVYIAGPMRGYPEFNFPMFDAVKRHLEQERGWATVNPADHDRDAALEMKGVTDITKVPGYAEGDLVVYEHTLGQVYDLLTWDIAKIANECDGIVCLPGWEQSTGSRIERFVAESLNKQVYLAIYHADESGLDNGWWNIERDNDKLMHVSVLERANA